MERVFDAIPHYLFDHIIEVLHIFRHRGVVELDRPRVIFSCAAAARDIAPSTVIHHPHIPNGFRVILSCGHLHPRQRRLVVRIDAEAINVHEADPPLALSIAMYGSDLTGRHRSLVVDRHAFTLVKDVAEGLSCEDVALWDRCADN